MICETLVPCARSANDKSLGENVLIARFLDEPSDDSFTGIYKLMAPRLLSFYRSRNCDPGLSEDLVQQVMFTVYRKAAQVRDRALFCVWLFKIAHNALRHHYGRQARKVEIVYVEDPVDLPAIVSPEPGRPAFEFMHWIDFLNPRERDVMTLRFVEQWEYHEIAAARDMPIGTVQSVVFYAKKKLARRLAVIHERDQESSQQSPRANHAA